MTVLDVGQGLAIVVETAAHVLVYDTGDAYGTYSAGTDVLAPYLRARGITRVDRVVLSHADRDHAGGWVALSEIVPVRDTIVSPGHALPIPVTVCRAGHRWQRDGVVFQFLSPQAGSRGSRNNQSCVLKIDAPGGSILLPGDIEAPREAYLLATAREHLSADVLVAPHHGSISSSSVAFVAAVDPRFVVFAADYLNRFGFPHPTVSARYAAHGAQTFTTGYRGALTFTVREDVVAHRAYRAAHRRYWHHE